MATKRTRVNRKPSIPLALSVRAYLAGKPPVGEIPLDDQPTNTALIYFADAIETMAPYRDELGPDSFLSRVLSGEVCCTEHPYLREWLEVRRAH